MLAPSGRSNQRRGRPRLSSPLERRELNQPKVPSNPPNPWLVLGRSEVAGFEALGDIKGIVVGQGIVGPLASVPEEGADTLADVGPLPAQA